jgi:hypothetical protein
MVAKDYVGRLDGMDVYKFVVNSNVTADINVGSLSENSVGTDLYKDINDNNLLDSGERLQGQTFTSTGGAAQSIKRSLDIGTYFFSIDRRLSTHNIAYTLTIQGS